MVLIDISFIIFDFIVMFSYLIGISTKQKLTLKNTYTYYTTARYIADKALASFFVYLIGITSF